MRTKVILFDSVADEFISVTPHTLTRATPEQRLTFGLLSTFPTRCPDLVVASKMGLNVVLEPYGGARVDWKPPTLPNSHGGWRFTHRLPNGDWSLLELDLEGEALVPNSGSALVCAHLEEAMLAALSSVA